MKNKKLLKILAALTMSGVALVGCFATGCKEKSKPDGDGEHTQHTYTYTDNGDGTHNGTCDVCDSTVANQAHVDADNNNVCDLCQADLSTAVEVESISVSGVSVIKVGNAATLTAEVTPAGSAVTWSITEGADKATINATTGEITASAAGSVTVQAKAGDKTATITLKIVQDTETLTYITSADELNAFRANATPSGTYKLACDIDMSGIVLEATKAAIGAGVTFDGDGYTISNVTYSDAASKTGIICASINGGTVTNVKFLNCIVTSTSESPAIVAGLCEGTSTFSKIEFNSCSVTTTQTYGGMLFARNTAANLVLTVSEITAKNGCFVSCSQYGGFLVGDILGTANATFKNLDLEGSLKGSSGNGAFIAGRNRGGANVTVENTVISADLNAPTNNCLISGGSAPGTITVKNVLITKSNSANLYKTSPTTTSIENLAVLDGVTVTGSTATGENTVNYLKTTLGFDFTDVWMEEGDGYRLKAASTNVKSEGAEIVSLKLNSANATSRYKEGETFSSSGLSIMGVYSDGVQLVLSEGTGYTVDSSAFKSEKGTYTITVKSKEDEKIVATYEVNVVKETGFAVYDEFMAHTYLVNETLDTSNLVIKSVWSDGVEEKVAASGYTISSSSYNMSTAGTYDVSISYGEYEAQTVAITVVNDKPVPVDGKVTINVDANSSVANGTKVDGVETFKTLADAIDYLEASKLDSAVTKLVNIAAGTYKAKITTSLSNLILQGENVDNTILTYSAVESTVNVVSGTQYGLDCATLQINGENFQAYDLTIRNDFNYIKDAANESSPQGLALTIAGDKAIISDCHLYGNQDTLYLKAGRAYFYNTLIEGNVDFIFGNETGIAFFEDCEIRSITRSESQLKNNGYVTAMKATADNKPNYGYIFYNCDFTDDGKLAEGSMSLGRPWGAAATVAMINCSFSKAYSTVAYDGKEKSRWYDMSGNSPLNADFCEYGSTGEGAITEAVAGGKILTAEQAANYTKANIFAAINGKCKWADSWDGTPVTIITNKTLNFADLGDQTSTWTVAETPEAILDGDITVQGEYRANGNSAQFKVGSVIKMTKPGAVTISWFGGGYGSADNGKITYKNGYATIEIVAGTDANVYIKSILIDYTDIPADTTDGSGEVNGTAYTYIYGGESSSEWSLLNSPSSTTNGTSEALKLETDKYLVLTVSGTKAVISATGFTTGSSKASKYLLVEFLDANGTVLNSIVGTTTVDKVDGDYTFENNIVETSSAFASIRLSCTTSGKSTGITGLTITVE